MPSASRTAVAGQPCLMTMSSAAAAALLAHLQAQYPGQAIDLRDVELVAARMQGLLSRARQATPAGMELSMLTFGETTDIGAQRMTAALAELSAQQELLASSLTFFKQQAGSIRDVCSHLQNSYWAAQRDECRQLFQCEPDLLQQLAQVLAAALQQLLAQGPAEDAEVSRTAAMVCDTTGWLLDTITERVTEPVPQPSTPAAAANLRMMRDTGVLRALASAARAAAEFFNSSPDIQRVEAAPCREEAAALMLYDPVHLYAAASGTLLALWVSLTHMMPMLDVMQPGSLLLETVQPCAALCVALSRAYAGDEVFGLPVLSAVLQASISMASAAVPEPGCTLAPARPNTSLLAEPELLELFMLCIAVATERLHTECRGVSRQPLLAALRHPVPAAAGQPSPPRSSRSSSRATGKGEQAAEQRGAAAAAASVAVSPHHQELLQALLGAREIPALHPTATENVLHCYSLFVAAIEVARTARVNDADTLQGPSSSGGSAAGRGYGDSSVTAIAARRQAVASGEGIPWQYALQLQLVQLEVAALAPPRVAERASLLHDHLCFVYDHNKQLALLTRTLPWAANLEAANLLCEDVFSLSQACLESMWLEAGPVLLSLFRAANGEASAADAKAPGPKLDLMGNNPSPMLFAVFGEALMHALMWAGVYGPFADMAAVAAKDPWMCGVVLEAVLHAAPARSGIGQDPLQHAGNTAVAGTVAIDFITEATARALAAQAGNAASSARAARAAAQSAAVGPLEQQLFCTLTAALKLTQFSPQGAAGVELQAYQHRLLLFNAASAAVHRLLGDASYSRAHLYKAPDLMTVDGTLAPAPAPAPAVTLPPRSAAQQLLWFHALGRSLVAAAALLEQVPQHVSASGAAANSSDVWPALRQFANIATVLRMLVVGVRFMCSMMQQGGAAAGAVAAGAPAAAATPADLVGLLQQAEQLQQQLASIHKEFSPEDYHPDGSWAGRPPIFEHPAPPTPSLSSPAAAQPTVPARQVVSALWRLRNECQSGELLQRLRGFGAACCSAFPQRGVCGNPLCVCLDKFSEGGLACRGCKGCNKAVMFCSAQCHKEAWKAGHKAACAVLSARQQQAQAAAAVPASP